MPEDEPVLLKVPTVVTSGKDGSVRDALKMVCGSCHGESFVVLLVGEEKSPHFSCVECGTMYCAHDSPCHQ